MLEAELLKEAIEWNEDLMFMPLNPEKLVGVGEVGMGREVVGGPLGKAGLESRTDHEHI